MLLNTNVTRGGLTAVGLTVVGVLLGWLVWGGAMFSPGGLSAAASSNEVLGGVTSHAALGRRCSACHASLTGGQPMSVQCLNCHTDTQSELRDSTSMHGGFDNARECLACHTEHDGPNASLVRFGAGAGDHARFGFALEAHRKTHGGAAFRCADCHRGGTFKFDADRCESCHRDYQPEFVATHVRVWGNACMTCHEGTDRFSPGRFSHDTTRFPLTGAHGPVECATCHVSVQTLSDFNLVSRECLTCHGKDDTHRGEFGTDCGACHTAEAWKPATFDHPFPIDHGEAGRVACKVCHEPGRSYREYTCYGCHEHTPERVAQEHREEGISGSGLTDCVRCHRTGSEHEGGHEGRHEREGDDD